MASFKQTLQPTISLSKLETPTYTMSAHKWNAITFVNSVKIISTQLLPQAPNASFLQYCSSTIGSTSTSSSTKLKLNTTI